MNSVVGFYENYDEESRLTTNKARRVEFITTTYFLDKVIKPEAKILDVAADGISPLLGRKIDEMNDEQYGVWIDYHLQTCREKSILGMSNHGLYICRKR